MRPSWKRAHEAPQGADAAQRQQRVGVVVARDGDGDGRDREDEAGDEARRAAPHAPRQVVDERDGRDAHERLRDEDAQRVKAEDPGRERLDPEGQRRLVDRHEPARVERAVEEVVPARAHRAHGGAVVLVGPAVAIERPEVQHPAEEQEDAELREGQRRGGAFPRRGASRRSRRPPRGGACEPARRARWRERAATGAGAGAWRSSASWARASARGLGAVRARPGNRLSRLRTSVRSRALPAAGGHDLPTTWTRRTIPLHGGRHLAHHSRQHPDRLAGRPGPATAPPPSREAARARGRGPRRRQRRSRDRATQQRTWADRSAVGQSTPWDAGREAPTNGQLVDAYG